MNKSPEDVVPDALRAHVARKEKEHRELMGGQRRALEAPVGGVAWEAGAEALAQEGFPGGGKGHGKSRAKAKARALAAPDQT